MVTVIGVDACPSGWLAVELHDGRFAAARVVTALRSLLPGALPDDLGDAGRTPPDDVLDAAAAAWTAHRIACGRARSVPNPPERDAGGRPVAIWY
ncbi:DUF429 domain-containing protein [Streptomyces sp. NPDC050355]|uniref:DUF429 domain-containing protein n=1 Tax=Streptomyces sp. NPDC050355 TaxID=3365609 RepID=UPI00378C7C13